MSLKPDDFCVIAAVNDDDTLSKCLKLSPDVVSGALKVTEIRNAASMSQAYNLGLERTSAPICIFAHQDVYLPAGWLENAIQVLNNLEANHSNWMVAGPYGVERSGQHAGRIWDVNMGIEIRHGSLNPVAVQSLDELLLVLRRTPDFRFDQSLPDWHLYGTDLVQAAWALGRSAWSVEMPVVHNNRPWASLGQGYRQAYNYVRRKWRHRLPIHTPVCLITYNPLPLWRTRWRRRNIKDRGTGLLAHAPDVAREAGYE